MPLLAAVVLPPAELEDDDLLGAVLSGDLGAHARAADEGLPELGRVPADHQDLFEFLGVAEVARELLDTQLLAFRDPVLLAARFDDRVHALPLDRRFGGFDSVLAVSVRLPEGRGLPNTRTPGGRSRQHP